MSSAALLLLPFCRSGGYRLFYFFWWKINISVCCTSYWWNRCMTSESGCLWAIFAHITTDLGKIDSFNFLMWCLFLILRGTIRILLYINTISSCEALSFTLECNTSCYTLASDRFFPRWNVRFNISSSGWEIIFFANLVQRNSNWRLLCWSIKNCVHMVIANLICCHMVCCCSEILSCFWLIVYICQGERPIYMPEWGEVTRYHING